MGNGPERGPERSRAFGGVKPTGQLGELLSRYGAPEAVQRILARRVGGVVGTNLPHSDMERTIQNSMVNGIPRWDQVEQDATSTVRKIYRGMRRA